MTSYLGNPRFFVMTQEQAPVANFEYPHDPTITVNPKRPIVSWLNTVTGELFICVDNTTDSNIWKGQMGTSVGV